MSGFLGGGGVTGREVSSGGCPEKGFFGGQMGFWGVRFGVAAAWLGEGGLDEAPTLSPRAAWG